MRFWALKPVLFAKSSPGGVPDELGLTLGYGMKPFQGKRAAESKYPTNEHEVRAAATGVWTDLLISNVTWYIRDCPESQQGNTEIKGLKLFCLVGRNLTGCDCPP